MVSEGKAFGKYLGHEGGAFMMGLLPLEEKTQGSFLSLSCPHPTPALCHVKTQQDDQLQTRKYPHHTRPTSALILDFVASIPMRYKGLLEYLVIATQAKYSLIHQNRCCKSWWLLVTEQGLRDGHTQQIHFTGLEQEEFSRENSPALMEVPNIMKALGKVMGEQLAWKKGSQWKGEGQ